MNVTSCEPLLSITPIRRQDVGRNIGQNKTLEPEMSKLQSKLSYATFSERGEWIGQHSIIAGWLERLNWASLDIIDNELMTRTRSKSGFREFNNVLATRIEETSVARDVTKCLQILAEDGAPSRWYLTNHPASSIIAEQLNSLGFTEYERYAIMAKDLQKLATPSGLIDRSATSLNQPTSGHAAADEFTRGEFGIVTDEPTLKRWTNTFAKVADYPLELESDWLDMLLSCDFQSDGPWRHYYYQEAGNLIGILSALWTDQIVSLETVGVLPGHRNKGIGSSLLRYALNDAANAGYHVAAAYPVDYLQAFFSNNSFEKFGSIDCISVGADRLPKTHLQVDRYAVTQPLASALESKENSRANI